MICYCFKIITPENYLCSCPVGLIPQSILAEETTGLSPTVNLSVHLSGKSCDLQSLNNGNVDRGR